MSQQLFAELILPLPLKGTFTYRIPEELHQHAEPGKRAVVQFGKKKIYTGIIRSIHTNQPKGFEIKYIGTILDETPIVTELHFSFWEWLSSYYMSSIGEVFKAALPSGLKLESESTIIYDGNDELIEASPDDLHLTDKEWLMLDVLRNKHSVRIKELQALVNIKNPVPILKGLIDKGIVTIEERLKNTYKPKKVDFIRLPQSLRTDAELNNVLKALSRAKQQQRLFLAFIQLSGFDEQTGFCEDVKKADLIRSSNVSYSVLKSLVDKNYLEIVEKQTGRLDFGTKEVRNPFQLNEKQEFALAQIKEAHEAKNVVLLHGVTSSGKTEIYIHLIKEYIEKGFQVLYLLPEIALTGQIITRLQNIFGNRAGVYHSKFNDSERVEIWNNIKNADDEHTYQLILGVRSSVFLPFTKLGLIIVDEEHENTYKQYDPAPRYNARDAAVVLATLHGAKVVLGTATPSLESYFNAKAGKYALVELLSRYKEIQLPEIQIIDTRKERRKRRMKGFFSAILLEKIEQTLSNGEQVILFQNRRGFAPYVECANCGWVPYCKHCDVSLTYHKYTNDLICHYCGYTLNIPHSCPDCKSTEIETKGFGTEKIEEEISILFPDASIARLDVDSTKSKSAHQNIISDFEQGKTNILIGTQMVTKGLDFDNVSLVGILNADNLLNFPDFRANERSFQLMAQVSGRAGRKNKRGLVLIQTTKPSHFIIKDVIDNSFENMFRCEVGSRKTFNYPPFNRLIEITVKHSNIGILDRGAAFFVENLRKIFGHRVLGPEYPLIKRIQNLYLKKILLKIEREKPIAKAKELLNTEITRINQNSDFKSLQIQVNIDPM